MIHWFVQYSKSNRILIKSHSIIYPMEYAHISQGRHYNDVIMGTMASQYQPHQCLLNRLFGRRSMKTPKLRVTGLCAGNSPGTGEFPAQMTSNAENVSIWWRHHVLLYIQPGYQAVEKRNFTRLRDSEESAMILGKCFHLMTSSCFTGTRPIVCLPQASLKQPWKVKSSQIFIFP